MGEIRALYGASLVEQTRREGNMPFPYLRLLRDVLPSSADQRYTMTPELAYPVDDITRGSDEKTRRILKISHRRVAPYRSQIALPEPDEIQVSLPTGVAELHPSLTTALEIAAQNAGIQWTADSLHRSKDNSAIFRCAAPKETINLGLEDVELEGDRRPADSTIVAANFVLAGLRLAFTESMTLHLSPQPDPYTL